MSNSKGLGSFGGRRGERRDWLRCARSEIPPASQGWWNRTHRAHLLDELDHMHYRRDISLMVSALLYWP
jgi:hypothetical protein